MIALEHLLLSEGNGGGVDLRSGELGGRDWEEWEGNGSWGVVYERRINKSIF